MPWKLRARLIQDSQDAGVDEVDEENRDDRVVHLHRARAAPAGRRAVTSVDRHQAARRQAMSAQRKQAQANSRWRASMVQFCGWAQEPGNAAVEDEPDHEDQEDAATTASSPDSGVEFAQHVDPPRPPAPGCRLFADLFVDGLASPR